MAKTMPRIKRVPITVIEDGEERQHQITVQKAGLGRWKQLTDSLKRLGEMLPQIAQERGHEDIDQFLEALDTGTFVQLIPDIFGLAVDEIVEILTIGTDADEEFIAEHVGVDEAVELFAAITEVNQLVRVVELGKQIPLLGGLAGTMKKPPPTKKRSSTKSSGGSKK